MVIFGTKKCLHCHPVDFMWRAQRTRPSDVDGSSTTASGAGCAKTMGWPTTGGGSGSRSDGSTNVSLFDRTRRPSMNGSGDAVLARVLAHTPY